MAKKDTWKDIDINFEQQKNGDIKLDTGVDAIKNSLINILSTMQGWRRMLPEFSLSLWGLLFEPMDESTAGAIGKLILGSIQRWDDRIIVDNIHVNANYRMQQYDITLVFRMKNLRESPETITTVLKPI